MSVVLSSVLSPGCSASSVAWIMDRTVRELVLISVVSLFSLAVAWEYAADLFAMFFAIAAAIAGEEAIRRSL